MSADRRTDLDWLRIAAFGVLILYHVGMFYVTWDWHVKSPHASDAIEPLMLLVNPWRLLLLFIISGAATRFMADKMSVRQLFGSRMGRLWPPLLLAIFVIVPPQSYYEVADAMRLGQLDANPHWLGNFYIRYVTASGHWCDHDGCLTTPTYNHMWFVAYLIPYTLIVIVGLALARALGAKARKGSELKQEANSQNRRANVAASALLYVLLPFLFLWITRATLSPIFGETHAIWNDWYLHVVDFAGFLFGFALAKHEPFFSFASRYRFLALASALAAWAAIMFYHSAYADADPPQVLRVIMRGVRELQAWGAIIAAFGFAFRHLRGADGPIRRYLTEGIFPFYVVHQTAIVVFAFNLAKLDLPLWIEAPVLISLTLLACWATYELARRIPVLRPWFGLRRNTPKKGQIRADHLEPEVAGGHVNGGRTDTA